MGFLCFFKRKQEKPVSLKQIQNKKAGELFVFKNGFFSTLIIFQSFFCDFPLIARSGTSRVTISFIGCAPHT